MIRTLLFASLLAACAATPDQPAVSEAEQGIVLAFHREHLTGDLYHYSLVLPIGGAPNAGIRVHRVVRELAPFVPRPSAHAAMLIHGDFATFDTSFGGMAPYLASHGIDVWGMDRRWTLATDDTSDFGDMGVDQEVADIHIAVELARAFRGGDKLALVGFSHGAELAYNYAAQDGRGIDGLVALDFFGAYAPADADLRAASCGNADYEYWAAAGGQTDAPNDFVIIAGTLDRDDPDGASPLDDTFTNHELFQTFLGETFVVAPITPEYRLLEPAASGDGFAHVSVAAAEQWLIDAPPHQSMLEAADLDARLCDDIPLAQIRQPLLYVGAGDGVGDRGLYTTTRVSSTDVSSFVVPGYGHGDLLFADDAAARVWQPLASWLARH